MRIITRPDFDGIVCAVLLKEALDIEEPICWVEPTVMHKGLIEVHEYDIIANLSYHPNCLLWFDHHVSNRPRHPFRGVFEIAPSAAGIIFKFFNQFNARENPTLDPGFPQEVRKFHRDYTELVAAADKFDSAQLTLQEVENPGQNPYILLTMTILSHISTDAPYWNHLVELLRKYNINEVLQDPEVKLRCETSLKNNNDYASLLRKHTTVSHNISITDFRSFEKMPVGNRFLVFYLFPGTLVNVKIRYRDDDREKVIVSIGHNIFTKSCRVNIGLLCARFEGGGHFGAGSCTFPVSKFEEYFSIIMDKLIKNEENSF
ncbi:MAG: exopolyphosphatase [Acidobacteria bacterium]|nr:exopolyphosphatase [Acidobacteriota bacterium]